MNKLIQAAGLPLVLVKKEVRVDSRVLAEMLEIENCALIQTVEEHPAGFEGFGAIRFEISKPPKGSKGGLTDRIVLFTEDQAYFAATLSKNSKQAVEVKFRLLKAFSELRYRKEANERDYLPYFHVLHDAGQAMFKAAQQRGSTTPEQLFHSNLERMVNKAFGLSKGERAGLNAAMKSAIGTAYQLGAQAIRHKLSEGRDHRQAYEAAKHVVSDFAALYLPKQTRLTA